MKSVFVNFHLQYIRLYTILVSRRTIVRDIFTEYELMIKNIEHIC